MGVKRVVRYAVRASAHGWWVSVVADDGGLPSYHGWFARREEADKALAQRQAELGEGIILEEQRDKMGPTD